MDGRDMYLKLLHYSRLSSLSPKKIEYLFAMLAPLQMIANVLMIYSTQLEKWLIIDSRVRVMDILFLLVQTLRS